MTNLCFFKLLFFIAALSSSLNGAEFYALLIGDTTDGSLGRSCRNDLKNMQEEVRKIAHYTGLNLHLVTLQDSSATIENLIRQVQEIDSSSNDVILFYVTSHGFHLNSQSDCWPNIYLGQSRQGVHFQSIYHLLMQKNPRLLISFADVCNNFMPAEEHPPVLLAKKAPIRDDKRKLKKQYQALFLSTRGSIIASASIPGKVSYSYLSKGSLFTFGFLDALKSEINTSLHPSWANIMANTLTNTSGRAKSLNTEQEAQFSLSGFDL